MGFRQKRYKYEEGELINNIFDSDAPMEGWSLDEYAAKAELTKQIEEKVATVRKKRAPKQSNEADLDGDST